MRMMIGLWQLCRRCGGTGSVPRHPPAQVVIDPCPACGGRPDRRRYKMPAVADVPEGSTPRP
jgi:DnaJ-class molecular chaperone